MYVYVHHSIRRAQGLETEEEGEEKMVRGILEVLLVDAKGLHNTDFLGKMDPYVVIRCRNYESKSNVAKDQGSNPVWDKKISFPVQLPCVDDQLKLVLRILDKDTFSSDEFVGETTIYLKELILEGAENGVAEMKPCSHAVVLADRTFCGSIRVGVKFTLKEERTENGYADQDEDLGGWKASFRE